MTHTLTKAITALTLAVASFLPANAQDAFFVYRNDGQFNVFYNDMIDSIVFSEIDLDSIVHEEFVVQEFHTPDSIYRIPIASIDSVGFQKPGTIYEKDVIQLNGNLFDYLISEDSMSLIFDSTIPSSLLPKVGDKLATVELSDKLPFGFAGLVREVQEDSCGYIVSCDTLQFEEVMYRFYGVNEIVLKEEEPKISYYSKKETKTFRIPFPELLESTLNLSWILQKQNNKDTFYGKERGAKIKVKLETIKKKGRITRVINKIIKLSYFNLQLDFKTKASTNVNIAGTIKAEDEIFGTMTDGFFKSENGEITFMHIPADVWVWGVPVHFAVNLKSKLSGTIATGFTYFSDTHTNIDITYYPYLSTHPTTSFLFNSFKCNPKLTYSKTDWDYIAGDISFGTALSFEIGLGVDAGWFGAEPVAGLGMTAELNIDPDALITANSETKLYETFKESCVILEAYAGCEGLVKFKIIPDKLEGDFVFLGDSKLAKVETKLDFLPKFAATRAIGDKDYSDGTTLEASTLITNDCIMPYTVGFTLFDNDGNKIGEPQWRDEMFWTRGDEPFIRYAKTWENIETGKRYHVYPTLKLFNYNVLATPKDDIAFGAIETLKADKGVNTATLHGHFKWEDDYESILTYGFIYGENKSLTIDSGSKIVAAGNTDGNFSAFVEGLSEETTYYYRAYLFVDGKPEYGDVLSFTTLKKPQEPEDKEENEGEEVDLGLSVNWRGWNVGATKPEEYGNYFAWGETSQKEYYAWQSYFENPYNENNEWIGSATTTDVAGTDKDAATVILGEKWRMPTYEEVKELMEKCSWTWSDYNGVKGYTVESNVAGYEGNFIFLPAAGNYDKTSIKQEGSYGGYWSSTPLDSESKAAAYIFYFYGETIHSTQSSNRYTGRTIRPVTPKVGQ